MISVIIPAFKNTEEFVKNLKRNIPFLKGNEIIVINDDPSKSIKEDLKHFSEITLIENGKNLGFGQTVNKGVRLAKKELIFLLNTDVILKDTAFMKVTEQFKKNDSLFGISFAQIERDGSTVGKNTYYWKQGFFYHTKAKNMSIGLNGWAEGGSCLIDRKKFVDLGGFDSLYTPFYWEDIDLSYRAWKKGYRIIFDPEVKVEHHHGGTTDKYIESSFKENTAARNHYIFIWKNITDSNLIWQHILLLPYNLLYFAFKKNRPLVKGFFLALPKLPTIIKSRLKARYGLTDQEVFNILRS